MSGENKWTPGPWWIEDGTGDIVAKDGYWEICTFTRDDEDYEADSNLISAAPDLYDELENLLSSYKRLAKDYEYSSGAGDLHPCHQEYISRTERALNKARGKL